MDSVKSAKGIVTHAEQLFCVLSWGRENSFPHQQSQQSDLLSVDFPLLPSLQDPHILLGILAWGHLSKTPHHQQRYYLTSQSLAHTHKKKRKPEVHSVLPTAWGFMPLSLGSHTHLRKLSPSLLFYYKVTLTLNLLGHGKTYVCNQSSPID